MFGAWKLHDIFAGAEQLHHRERKIRKCPGSAALRWSRNSDSARGSGVAGSLTPKCAAMAWMRSHRFGVLTTRRMEREPFSLRYGPWPHSGHHETLDDVIGHRAPADRQVLHFAIFQHRRGFNRAEGERPVLFANATQLFRSVLLQAELCLHAGHVATAGGIGPCPSNQAPVEM